MSMMSSLGLNSLAVPESLAWAHPLVQEWFVRRFGTPTEPQEQGWPHILAGHTTLISAPTGSGKTLAAFLACIDRLVRKALAGDLQNRTEVLYVSPLKALGNDIQKNLEIPLTEIGEMAAAQGQGLSAIRSAVRTGDTTQWERQQMLADLTLEARAQRAADDGERNRDGDVPALDSSGRGPQEIRQREQVLPCRFVPDRHQPVLQ